jgi:hypothetical protein
MGSSRVMHGYGANVPDWGKMKVCNVAVGGTSIAEQRDIFDWVLRQRSVKMVVFYLDFHTFNAARGSNGDFAQSRFNRDRSRLTYFGWGLTSWDATKGSFRALGRPLTYFDTIKVPLTQVHANRIELFRFFNNPHLYTGWTGDPETMGVLQSMIADAVRARMRPQIVIPSVHALLLETERMTSTWEQNQAWKRALVELVDNRFKGRVPIWDFSNYHQYSEDPMPIEQGDPQSTWWIDVSHQSAQLGWMTMARTLYDEIPEAVVKTGVPGVGQWDERSDADRDAWVAAHPEQIAWLHNYAEELRAQPTVTYDPENDALEPGEFIPDVPGADGMEQQIERSLRLQ